MAVTIKDITQRIIIPGVQWCTYEQLLRDRGDSHAVYLTYDQGILELMAPSFSHEHANRILAMIVETVALSSFSAGPTPMRAPSMTITLALGTASSLLSSRTSFTHSTADAFFGLLNKW